MEGMGVLAGVAEMIGVELLLLMLLLLLVPGVVPATTVPCATLGAVGVDLALAAVALVALMVAVLVVPVVDDFFVVEEEDARAFLGGVLVDLIVVSGTEGSGAGPLEAAGGGEADDCSTACCFTLEASNFFLSCKPHSLARRFASSSLLFFEDRGATATLPS